ncbi:MAG: TolC family protein [Acidobacteria bacterium]|nr:TolC family protein [Acidobacteriota bacterium]
MKSLRFYALFFTLSVVFGGLNAGRAAAQAQPTAPQIAKNTKEARTNTAQSEDSADKPETPSAPSYSLRTNAPIVTRVGVQNAQTLPLTLNEAIRRALENNNDIEVAKNDVRIAESNLRSLLGIYDGVFTIQPNLDRSSSTGRGATTDFRVNSDFTQQIRPGGGSIKGFLNNSRTENQFAQQQVTSGTSTSSSAVFSTSLGVTYTQPLWRNLKVDSNRRQIKIQRKRVSQSDADFRRQAILVISQVQSAYWDLVFALRNQQNQVANVNLSRENLRVIEAKISAGSSAPLEKAEVMTELANREGELLNATQQVSTAENRLKQLFLRDPNSSDWLAAIVPTDAPVFSNDPVDMDAAMKDAMEFRPELSRLRLEKEINKIDLDFYKNQTKPRVDLVSTFSLDGLALGKVSTSSFTSPLVIPQTAGSETSSSAYFYNLICRSTITPPPGCATIPSVVVSGTPSYYNGGFNRSFANLFRSDAPNFTVGVTFSFPLRNKTAKADLATARLQTERIDAQTRSQEQTVIAEVRNAVQAVETARLRIATARTARENAEIQLEGERKLFEVGRSTTFLLFQRENALTNARNSEIRAETDYNKALSELQRVTSTTFRVNNIQVDSPAGNQQ